MYCFFSCYVRNLHTQWSYEESILILYICISLKFILLFDFGKLHQINDIIDKYVHVGLNRRAIEETKEMFTF